MNGARLAKGARASRFGAGPRAWPAARPRGGGAGGAGGGGGGAGGGPARVAQPGVAREPAFGARLGRPEPRGLPPRALRLPALQGRLRRGRTGSLHRDLGPHGQPVDEGGGARPAPPRRRGGRLRSHLRRPRPLATHAIATHWALTQLELPGYLYRVVLGRAISLIVAGGTRMQCQQCRRGLPSGERRALGGP